MAIIVGVKNMDSVITRRINKNKLYLYEEKKKVNKNQNRYPFVSCSAYKCFCF